MEQCIQVSRCREVLFFWHVSQRILPLSTTQECSAEVAEAIAQRQKQRGKIHECQYVRLWLVHKGMHKNPKTIQRVM